ncbi:MAG: hypothetical protein J6R86_00275 [Lentisphaeria bacterium]|nr:hypothetical protein [Lentisphaeria bacterium]
MAVKDISGNDDSFNIFLFDDRADVLQQGVIFIKTFLRLQRNSEMSVGGVQNLHKNLLSCVGASADQSGIRE